MRICHEFEIRLPSLANTRMHWRAMDRLKAGQKARTAQELWYAEQISGGLPALPATVTLTRVGKRKLDGDNLQGAFKYIRDAVAAKLGIDDGSDLYDWQYRQEIGGKYAIRIEITTKESPCQR